MYGGAGLGGNAGGVRCANLEGVQIKGIGCTPLAGHSTDKWHRHGALSLQDAVREVLMGELIHVATPYGAVRGLGIADLGESFATEVGEEGLPGSAPRALLYRELSVRLAHFMRSSYMDAGPELARRELDRMRDGMPRFVNWLCGDAIPSFESAARGMGLVFDRLMHQIAVLRTKRLVHGSLIPSNFCIDGRLLDFTTSTAVSTLQPVMVSLGGMTTQQQHHQMLKALPEVLFYIAKFDPRCAMPRRELEAMAERLKAHLNFQHHEYLMAEHLGLFGFSQDELQRMSRGAQEALLTALLQAIGCGTVRGHFYFGGDEHPMLPQEGRDDLFALVAGSIATHCGLALPLNSLYSPQPDAFPVHVRSAFEAAYGAAVDELQIAEEDVRVRGFGWLVRAMQRNADLTPLYRRNLDGVINEVCTTAGGDFGALIEQTLADWSNVFATPDDGSTPLSGWLTVAPCSLQADGRLSEGDSSSSVLALATLEPAPRIRPRHRWLFEVAAANRGALT